MHGVKKCNKSAQPENKQTSGEGVHVARIAKVKWVGLNWKIYIIKVNIFKDFISLGINLQTWKFLNENF